MTALLRHPLRVTGRLLWLGGDIVLFLLSYVVTVALRRGGPHITARTRWLQASSRRTLRILGLRIHTEGPIPTQGLIVSNHLSYLDVLVLSSITPVVFVAKSEVARWPIFGWFARLAGTLFVRRSHRADVVRLNREIVDLFAGGVPIVLFPEGTSSDGRRVLPFKSSLLEPARQLNPPLYAALIDYEVTEGVTSREVCYWGDMTLLPHLINLLSKRGVRASVSLKTVAPSLTSRKALARQLHAQVSSLRQGATSGMPA
jgi:1-acyl-sn-glycerol-3-phosphate acyltransferase